MSMTKKDYELIAKPFNEAVSSLKESISGKQVKSPEAQTALLRLQTIEILVQALSNELLKDNPNYNSMKFYHACGL